MMLRTCPKCSAYYADELLAFCLVDGMPLLAVDPGSRNWVEGARVLEEKTSASRKQQRRIKWRRVALTAITTLLLTMVVARSFTVETTSAGTKPTAPVTSSSSPAPPVSPLLFPPEALSPTESPSPSESESPSPTHSETSSPTETETSTDTSAPTGTETSEPARVYKISGRVMEGSQPLAGVKVTLEGSKLTSTTTDANGDYILNDLRAGGSYTITPRATMNFAPQSRSFDDLKQDSAADFVAQIKLYRISGQVIYSGRPLSGVKITLEGSKLTSTITDANGNYTFGDLRAGGSYTVSCQAKVNLTPPNHAFNNLAQDESANFSGVGKVDPPPPPPSEECSDDDKRLAGKSILDTFSAGWRKKIEQERAKIIADNAKNGVQGEASLTQIDYQSVFPKGCKLAVVTLTYTWLIKTNASAVALPRTTSVPKRKVFPCSKFLGLWACSY
jgi:hypothetical protein